MLTHEQKLAFIHKMTKMGLDHTQGPDVAHMAAGGVPPQLSGQAVPGRMSTQVMPPQPSTSLQSAGTPGVTATGPTTNSGMSAIATGGNNDLANPAQGVGKAIGLGDNPMLNPFNALTNALTNNYKASAANTQAGTNAAQLDQAYTGTQSALNDQGNLVVATQPGVSQGINAQNTLSGQLANEANGMGPNPAQSALNQSTGQNIAQQAALAANTRGASSNAGLIAQNNAQQGANTQQQAVGQAATLQAQQQIAAQQQQQQLAAQQVGQGAGAVSAENQMQQGEQGILQGSNTAYNNALVSGQNNINSVNAGVAAGNQNMMGQIANGAMKAVSALFARGGMVRMDRGGNVLDAKARNSLPHDAFALPGRRYPIHDIHHARNALARVSQNGNPEEKSRVKLAVHKRYPEIKKMAEGGAVGCYSQGGSTGRGSGDYETDPETVPYKIKHYFDSDGSSSNSAPAPVPTNAPTTTRVDNSSGNVGNPMSDNAPTSEYRGGMISKMASGGQIRTPVSHGYMRMMAEGGSIHIQPLVVMPVNSNGPQSSTGQWLNSNPSAPSIMETNVAGPEKFKPDDSAGMNLKREQAPLEFGQDGEQVVSGGGDNIPGGSRSGLSPDTMTAYSGGLAAKGGPVNASKPSQKAVVKGDSLKNDKVPAMLSEGEVVMDRETLQDPGPVGKMARAVAMHIKKRNGKK